MAKERARLLDPTSWVQAVVGLLIGHPIEEVAQRQLIRSSTTGYGKRALIETTMGGYKAIIGPRLRARDDAGRRAEAAVGAVVLNRMLASGRPSSVRAKVNVA